MDASGDSSSFVHVGDKAKDDDDNHSDEEESLSFVILDEEEEQRKEEDSARERSKAGNIQSNQEIPETETYQSEEVNVKRETLENEILEAIRQAGLDDKFWIKKIREEFKVESVEELKNVTKEQVEVFLQNTETTIQSRLRPVFSNLIGVDLSSRETVTSESVDLEHVKLEMKSSQKVVVRRTDGVESENIVSSTEAGVNENVEVIYSQDDREGKSTIEPTSAIGSQVEALLQSIGALDQGSLSNIFADSLRSSRSIENSGVCNGIYFTEDINKLVEDREMLTNVCDDAVFTPSYLEQPLYHREFTSRESLRIFSTHIDRSVSAVSMEMNIFGIDLPDTVICAGAADNFVGCVHYQLVPVVSVQLSPHALSLRPEVISALQNVEQTLKLSDYLPGNHFVGFFEKYGSHFCGGVVELGGILVSIAECSGFKEGDRSKMAHMLTKASEMAFLLGFNEKVQPGQPYRADVVLGDVADISAEFLQNITITIKKIGGFQDAEEKDKWKEKLRKDDGKQWKVIRTSSPPSGIWEFIQKYADQFEDHKKLAESMMKEWETEIGPKQKEIKGDESEDNSEIGLINQQRRRRRVENEQVALLRKDIGLWIEECRHQNPDELDERIKRLGDIRTRYQKIDQHWHKEVLYLREVQTTMVDAAKLMVKINKVENKDETAMSDRSAISEGWKKKRQLSSLLRHILHPIDTIQENKFPNVRLITESINEVDGIDQTEPFEITSIQQLPEEWRRYKTLMKLEKENPNLPLKSAQLKLELTIKQQEQSPVKTYEYLIFFGVLQIFGFDTTVFRFGYQLSKRDMDNIFRLFEEHVTKIDHIQEDKQKQAYIFQVALNNMENKEAAVLYMLRAMGERLCSDFQDIRGPDDTVNMPALKDKLQDSLPEDTCSDQQSFAYAFEKQFRFVQPFQKVQIENHQDISSTPIASEDLSTKESILMKALRMQEYYPGKLTYDKVITLTSDVNDDVNKKPTSLPELPWYFIKHVIGLDSDTRKNCYDTGAQDLDDKDSDTDSEDDDKGIINGIHPLDLEKVIMMCADDFLRQELMDKMIRCQYAVPFIVPTSHDSNLILLWALESVMRSFYHEDQDTTKTLVDMKTPLVSFMNVGEERCWKSKLLNKMLNSQQEMFWHQELEGGGMKQKISEGLVEVAWFLSGREGDNKFPFPVTFSNLRGNAAHSDLVCHQLFKSSSVICLFVEDIDAEVEEFLHKRSSLERVVLTLLHSKRETDTMKQKVKKLKKEFTLREDQIIRKTEDGSNFNTVYVKIKTFVDNTLSTVEETFSLKKLPRKQARRTL